MIERPEFYVAYSKDQAAVAELAYWQGQARDAGFFEGKRRAEAKLKAEEARQRCIDAGIDWDRVPRPPVEFQAPDRLLRPPIGQPAAFEPPVSASSVPQESDAAVSRDSTRRSANGSVIAGAGAGFAGAVAGSAIVTWLRDSATEPVGTTADGAAFYEYQDGSLWMTGPGGQGMYGLTDTGGWVALDGDGMMWGVTGAGDLVSWASDGTMVSLQADGSLAALGADGSFAFLGDDGEFYAQSTDGSWMAVASGGEFVGQTATGEEISGDLDPGASDPNSAGSLLDWI